MPKNFSGSTNTNTVLSDSGDGVSILSWTPANTVRRQVDLNYSWMSKLPTNASADIESAESSFRPLTSAQRAATERALALMSEVANINFTLVPEDSEDPEVPKISDIQIGTIDFDRNAYSANTVGLAFTAWNPATDQYSNADVYLSTKSNFAGDISEGSQWFVTMLHELAHAVGLDHIFEGRRPPEAFNNEQYSLMAYNRHPSMSIEPSTFMLFDIAALQYLYGANMTTRSGDSVYSWARNAVTLETIWDAGGNDTIDASVQTRNVTIDLNPGEFSSIGENGRGGTAVDNVAIAEGAVIENARGGSGNDRLFGNAGANEIHGNAGNDSIFANGGADRVYDGAGNDTIDLGSGDDVLFAGSGTDTYDGGTGNDILSFYGSETTVTFALNGASTGNTVSGFETLSGSDGAGDQLTGSSGTDRLVGHGGDDVLVGLGGNDRLYGGSGSDTLRGDAGSDFLDGGGGAGVDQLFGGAGSDEFHFDKGDGRDVIKDFANNEDRLVLDNFDFANVAQAMNSARDVDGDVVFDFGNDGSITVENITISQLQDDISLF